MPESEGSLPEREDRSAGKVRRVGKLFWWAVAIVVAALVGFAPGWWERRIYRQQEALAGVEAPIRAGALADARKKIDIGLTAVQVIASVGEPSLRRSTEGPTPRAIWTYYYRDGTMDVNLTSGVVRRIALTNGAPFIAKSKRPH